MNPVSSFKSSLRVGLGLLAAMAVYAASSGLVSGADTNAPVAKTAKVAQKKLTGSELYAINCNRCHQERYPTEFTAAQWKTIATHMRVRANLPAAQVKTILKYLQEDAGN